MLTETQIIEIREHLEKAQNPIFFYDNDADGLCSYVLLRKFTGRGKGVAVRSHPDVDEGYARKVQELQADYVFVLDRPMLGEAFVAEIAKLGLPIVWIDHHDVGEEGLLYEHVYVYNPRRQDPRSEEPVSFWCYKIANRIEDMWIAMMGCIADHYLPPFADEFVQRWPTLWGASINEPFDAYYTTEVGMLARVLGFALKDSITHVVSFQNFLIECKAPADMAVELDSNKPFARKYGELKKKYDLLMQRASETVGDTLLFFTYGGTLSISSEISNELSYRYGDHTVVVAYSSGPITNISLRGDNVKGIIEEILPSFEHASGGGHRDAVGVRLQSDDLERFRQEVEKRL